MGIRSQSLSFPPTVVCGLSFTAAVTGSEKDSRPCMKVHLKFDSWSHEVDVAKK